MKLLLDSSKTMWAVTMNCRSNLPGLLILYVSCSLYSDYHACNQNCYKLLQGHRIGIGPAVAATAATKTATLYNMWFNINLF